MLCSQDRIDTAFFPYALKSRYGMIHTDHLGTPQKMTDSSGVVVWAADYKPFGEVNITTNTITNNLRFPGQYYDVETGLNYNYYRDYNPVIGRYIESDPMGLIGGMNSLFPYVGNNPIRRMDPLGLTEGPDLGSLIENLEAFGDFMLATKVGGQVINAVNNIKSTLECGKSGDYGVYISKVPLKFISVSAWTSGNLDPNILAYGPYTLSGNCSCHL